jgi:hypothetical protein
MDWPTELGLPHKTWETLSTEEKLWCIWIENRDIFGQRISDWPPTDQLGNPYPYEWIPVDDIDESGQLTDSRGNQYNPFAGNRTPRDGQYRCNAPLTNYEQRYGEVRYCAQAYQDADEEYCHVHRGRENVGMKAKELLQHGLSAKTRDHFYNKLDDAEQLLVHGIHEDLLDESTFEFAVEYEQREFSLDDLDVPLTDVHELIGPDTDTIAVDVPYATEHIKRSFALLAAATDTVKEIRVQPELLAAGMAVDTASHAEHVDGQWSTYEEVAEHPLNLAYSRLVTDEKELLKYGGVPIDGETTTTTSNPLLDRLEDVQSMREDITTADQELVREGSEMQRQADAADVDDITTVDD